MVAFLPPSSDNAAQQALQDNAEKLNIFFRLLQDQDTTSSSRNCCESGTLNIEKYIPSWIIQEKETKGGDVLTIFDFIQKYYDWLYCSSDYCGGSGYILEDKLLEVIDVEKTKELYYKKIFFSYFGDFDENEQIKDVNGLVIDNETVANFVKNIKTKFNSRKGSIDSLNLFFNKLFSVNLNDISITYPKEQILRLNSGAFSSQNSGFSGNVQNGTFNNYRLQDGNWFQEYSYILHTGLTLDISDYYSFYSRSLHPSGLKCILERRIEDYIIDPVDPDNSVTMSQVQKIGNYSAYILGQTYNNNSTYELIVSGTTYYGLTYTVGCTLSGSSFGAIPSYVFPSWTDGMTGYNKFTDIPILNMNTLYYTINNTNPNKRTTC